MRIRLFSLVILAVLTAGCSAIKVETGSSEQEQADNKSAQASQLRREWGSRFDTAQPQQRPHVLIELLRSLIASYDRLGRQIGDEWERGNTGRGSEIPGEEMRAVVEASLARDNPVLSAWDDALEYGFGRVRDDRVLSGSQVDTLVRVLDKYYAYASTVRYPSGSVLEYRDKLNESNRVIIEELARLEEVFPR